MVTYTASKENIHSLPHAEVRFQVNQSPILNPDKYLQEIDLALARKLYSYGVQQDYFDYPTCIGWVRYGTWDKKFGCAVVMSNAGPGEKRMHVGEMHAGEVWTDVLGWEKGEVTIGDDGFGNFICAGTSVSVWVNKEAEGREKFGKL